MINERECRKVEDMGLPEVRRVGSGVVKRGKGEVAVHTVHMGLRGDVCPKCTRVFQGTIGQDVQIN